MSHIVATVSVVVVVVVIADAVDVVVSCRRVAGGRSVWCGFVFLFSYRLHLRTFFPPAFSCFQVLSPFSLMEKPIVNWVYRLTHCPVIADTADVDVIVVGG